MLYMFNFFIYIYEILFNNPAPFVIIITIILGLPMAYKILYTNLNIPRSMQSFIFFSMNAIILFLYIYGIIRMLYYNLSYPIHIENLPLLAQYRYLISCLLIILTVTLYFILIYIQKLNFNMVSFTSFWFKEPFIDLIQNMPSLYLFFNKICSKFLNILSRNKYSIKLFLISHFITFYLFKLMMVFLFLSFCMFHTDLRLLSFLIPISFIIWIFSFFNYFFFWFIEDNYGFTKDLLKISLINNSNISYSSINYILTERDNFHFELTSFADKEGFKEKDLEFLQNSWFTLINLKTYFVKYNYFVTLIPYIIFVIYSICWFYICFIYFMPSNIYLLVNPFSGFFLIIKRPFHVTAPAFANHRGFWIKPETTQNKVRQESDQIFSPGHPLYGQTLKNGNIGLQGQLSKDKNNRINNGTVVDAKDTKGNPNPQKAFPFNKVIEVKPSEVKEDPQITKFLNQPHVETKLDEISPPTE